MSNKRFLLMDAINHFNRLIPITRELNNDSTATIIELRSKFSSELKNLSDEIERKIEEKQSNCIHHNFIKYINKDGVAYECTECGKVLGDLPLGANVSKIMDR